MIDAKDDGIGSRANREIVYIILSLILRIAAVRYKKRIYTCFPQGRIPGRPGRLEPYL